MSMAVFVVYAFSVTVVFLNLLIAAFNSSYQEWAARREEHQLLERASIILDIELCLTPLRAVCPGLFRRLFPLHLPNDALPLALLSHSQEGARHGSGAGGHTPGQPSADLPTAPEIDGPQASGTSAHDPEAITGITRRLGVLEELTQKVMHKLKAISTRQLTSLQILRLGSSAGVQMKDL